MKPNIFEPRDYFQLSCCLILACGKTGENMKCGIRTNLTPENA